MTFKEQVVALHFSNTALWTHDIAEAVGCSDQWVRKIARKGALAIPRRTRALKIKKTAVITFKQKIVAIHITNPKLRTYEIAAAVGCRSTWVNEVARDGALPIPRSNAAPIPEKKQARNRLAYVVTLQDKVFAVRA